MKMSHTYIVPTILCAVPSRFPSMPYGDGMRIVNSDLIQSLRGLSERMKHGRNNMVFHSMSILVEEYVVNS
jgi:hypothetical protein